MKSHYFEYCSGRYCGGLVYVIIWSERLHMGLWPGKFPSPTSLKRGRGKKILVKYYSIIARRKIVYLKLILYFKSSTDASPYKLTLQNGVAFRKLYIFSMLIYVFCLFLSGLLQKLFNQRTQLNVAISWKNVIFTKSDSIL